MRPPPVNDPWRVGDLARETDKRLRKLERRVIWLYFWLGAMAPLVFWCWYDVVRWLK